MILKRVKVKSTRREREKTKNAKNGIEKTQKEIINRIGSLGLKMSRL